MDTFGNVLCIILGSAATALFVGMAVFVLAMLWKRAVGK